MMRTLGLLLVAGLAVVAFAPSATAMKFIAPQPPNPECPVTPEPTDGGVVGAAEQIAHDETSTTCGVVDIGKAQGQAGFTFAMTEVGIVVGILSPAVDGTQDAACTFLFGNPDANNAVCHEVVLNLDVHGF